MRGMKHLARVTATAATMAAALAVAQTAQASTILMGIRSGAATSTTVPALCSAAWPTPLAACAASNSVAVTDGSSVAGAVDGNADPGKITWAGTIGGWTLSVAGIGSDVLGSGIMNLNVSASRADATADILEIYFSQLGNSWTSANPFLQLDFEGQIQNGTVTALAAECPKNMDNFMMSRIIGTLGPFSAAPFDVSIQGSTISPVGQPYYALTQRIQITAGGATTFHGDTQLQPVPEPASMLLLGTGILGLAARLRSKKRT
jgi:hypothetical protein